MKEKLILTDTTNGKRFTVTLKKKENGSVVWVDYKGTEYDDKDFACYQVETVCQ